MFFFLSSFVTVHGEIFVVYSAIERTSDLKQQQKIESRGKAQRGKTLLQRSTKVVGYNFSQTYIGTGVLVQSKSTHRCFVASFIF